MNWLTNFVRPKLKPVLVRELLPDGLFGRRRTASQRVFGVAVPDGLDRRLFDVVRGIEVRLARAKTNDIHASCPQLLGGCLDADD